MPKPSDYRLSEDDKKFYLDLAIKAVMLASAKPPGVSWVFPIMQIPTRDLVFLHSTQYTIKKKTMSRAILDFVNSFDSQRGLFSPTQKNGPDSIDAFGMSTIHNWFITCNNDGPNWESMT